MKNSSMGIVSFCAKQCLSTYRNTQGRKKIPVCLSRKIIWRDSLFLIPSERTQSAFPCWPTVHFQHHQKQVQYWPQVVPAGAKHVQQTEESLSLLREKRKREGKRCQSISTQLTLANNHIHQHSYFHKILENLNLKVNSGWNYLEYFFCPTMC